MQRFRLISVLLFLPLNLVYCYTMAVTSVGNLANPTTCNCIIDQITDVRVARAECYSLTNNPCQEHGIIVWRFYAGPRFGRFKEACATTAQRTGGNIVSNECLAINGAENCDIFNKCR
ncbi:hypothetical protein F5H01DRAFT_359014 [Linnemannia elongata]|nr:hypothetical protein F5H01DRAFT_359014 [Linnemannia elongata]